MGILYAVTTEKAVGLIEKRNTLTFIATENSTKDEIKKEVEANYKVKVSSVNTLHNSKGKKKVYVRLSKEFKADDVAAKLGIA